MFKRILYLSILISFLNVSISFAASPGINLINNPESAAWVPDPAVKNWMTIIPETPEGLARFNNISAQNVIVRIHAGWTDIGKKMLSDNASQTQAATDWCNVLNSYSPGKTKYIEPFNELEQDYERVSLSGNLDLATAITRADSFIGKLQTCLTAGTIISPALDPQNANFPITSAAFSRFSIISYHPYREDTAKNYSWGSLAGKTFIFTEVGVDNGGVVYDDCEFIKFFCGKGITAFWQGQSDILAYTLFTFSPGNYSGSWRLTNPQVTNALKADCSDPKCTPNLTAKHLLSRAWGYIPPVILSEKAVKGVPNNADPKHPEDKSSGFYSNSLGENMYRCAYMVNPSQTFNPKKIGVGASGEDIYQEQPINEINQQLDSDQYTNAGFRNSSIHLAKSQSPDLSANDDDLNKKFLNYGDSGENAVVRYLPEKDKLYVKGTFIEDACLSLDGKHDVIATDEQLAWGCPDGAKNLFPKPDNASSCRPVTVCEVGWSFYKRDKPTSYEIPKDSPLKSIPLPGDVVINMSNQFEGPGYQNTFGKAFSPLSDNVYDILYSQLPLVPRGSVNTQISTKDDKSKAEEPKEIILDRTLPLAAPLSSRQTTYALDIFNSKNDQEINSLESGDLVCTKITKENPIVDKPTPISLLARILAFFGIVKEEQKTFTGQKEAIFILPESLVKNLKQDEGFLKSGLPSSGQKDTDLENISKSSTDGVVTRDPGLKDAAARNMFDDYLKPQDWQKVEPL